MKNDNSQLPLKRFGNICLTSSIILLAASLTGPGSEFLWGFLKPLSALLFVNFFIMNLLAKEYAKHDEEHDLRLTLAEGAMQRRAEVKREPIRHAPLARPTVAH